MIITLTFSPILQRIWSDENWVCPTIFSSSFSSLFKRIIIEVNLILQRNLKFWNLNKIWSDHDMIIDQYKNKHCNKTDLLLDKLLHTFHSRW